MSKKFFEKLLESIEQADEILRGERPPSRVFYVDSVREIRALTHLSQPKFAKLLQVDVGTLRNWEQGRRQPTGPAKALLRAIKNNPQAVLKALAEEEPRELGTFTRTLQPPTLTRSRASALGSSQ